MNAQRPTGCLPFSCEPEETLGDTCPAELDEAPPHLREGWETEPIEVRFPWWLVLGTVALSCLASAYLSAPQ